MTVRVIKPLTDSKEMTENYISALYGCSLIEFARQIEREKCLKATNLDSLSAVNSEVCHE